MGSDAFAAFHPAVTFAWFIGAIVATVMVANPAWIAMAFAGAAAFYLMVRGRAGWKLVLGMIPVFIALSLANGLFNPRGATVLFTYFGRPYTLEAVLYGMQTAGMFVSVMLLFASYNRVMTSDKFTYLFGGVAPSVTLVLTMALRFVPNYLRKAKQIAGARDCIGKGAGEGGLVEKARHGSGILGALATWALESGVVTADSMRSRGYGSIRPRTQFAHYRFSARDGWPLAALCLLMGIAFLGIAQGASAMEFFPRVVIPSATFLGATSFAAFSLFMLIPFAVDLRGRLSWRNSISKI